MKKLLVVLFALLTSTAFAQWTQLPHASGSFGTTSPGARPRFSGYNRVVYDTFMHASFSRDRINTCGDPFTNSDWLWYTSNNTFQNIGWSGGGQLINGFCASPPTEPDPQVDGISEPGDRHPYHQYAYMNAGIWLTGGVEDNTKCDDSGSGICNYHDMWRFDDAAGSWSKKADAPYNVTEGALEGAPQFNQVFLFGGIVSGNAVNRMTRYDVASNTWTQLTPTGQAPPLHEDGAGLIYDPDNQVFVIWGGHDCATCTPTTAHTQVYLFNPSTNAYSKPVVSGTVPPVDVFPKMDYDTLRHVIVLYVAGSGVYTYSVPTANWTKLSVTGGPQLYSGLRNSLTMTYDSDTDTHLVHAYGCNCFWELKLP